MHYTNNLYQSLLGTVSFVAISSSECPCNENDLTKCKLPECSISMSNNELCEADQILPDGNGEYNINNCPANYDIFRCARGTKIEKKNQNPLTLLYLENRFDFSNA